MPAERPLAQRISAIERRFDTPGRDQTHDETSNRPTEKPHEDGGGPDYIQRAGADPAPRGSDIPVQRSAADMSGTKSHNVNGGQSKKAETQSPQQMDESRQATPNADPTDIEARLDAIEAELADLQAGLQAIRGYVGNIDHVNESVERRANAALAAVERLEAAPQTPPRWRRPQIRSPRTLTGKRPLLETRTTSMPRATPSQRGQRPGRARRASWIGSPHSDDDTGPPRGGRYGRLARQRDASSGGGPTASRGAPADRHGRKRPRGGSYPGPAERPGATWGPGREPTGSDHGSGYAGWHGPSHRRIHSCRDRTGQRNRNHDDRPAEPLDAVSSRYPSPDRGHGDSGPFGSPCIARGHRAHSRVSARRRASHRRRDPRV